jgi:hypothetical protein
MLSFAKPDAVGPCNFLLKLRKRRENNMRVFALLTGNRLGSRHLVFGVETLLALTLCLLVARAVAQF